MASTYTPIATTTVSGTSTTTVTFSSIPSTYTDLVLISNSGSSTASDLNFELNSDQGDKYSWTALGGNGTSAGSTRYSSQTYSGRLNWYAYQSTSNYSLVNIAHFMNYSNSTTYKTILSRSNNSALGTDAVVNLYRSTSAITQIKLLLASNWYFLSGSTFTLYGITAA